MGNDTVAYDNFGSSCAIYDTTLVVGAEKAFGVFPLMCFKLLSNAAVCVS